MAWEEYKICQSWMNVQLVLTEDELMEKYIFFLGIIQFWFSIFMTYSEILTIILGYIVKENYIAL